MFNRYGESARIARSGRGIQGAVSSHWLGNSGPMRKAAGLT